MLRSKNCTCMVCYQRGGSTIEYQSLPSLRDVAHDFCAHLVIDQPQTGASGVVHQGRRHGPSIMYKITPWCVLLLQQARRAAVLDQPSISVGLIVHATHRKYTITIKKTYSFLLSLELAPPPPPPPRSQLIFAKSPCYLRGMDDGKKPILTTAKKRGLL